MKIWDGITKTHKRLGAKTAPSFYDLNEIIEQIQITQEEVLNMNFADTLVRLEREGESMSGWSWISGPTTWPDNNIVAGAGTAIVTAIIPYTKACYLRSLMLGSNKNTILRIQTTPGGAIPGVGNPGFLDMTVLVPANQTLVIPMNRLMFGSIETNLTVNIKKVFDVDLTNCHWTVGASGFFFTDDPAYNAKKTILWIWDSIYNGNGVLTGTDKVNSWTPWLVRDYYRNTKNEDVRLVNMSVSSSYSPGHEYYRKEGKYDLDPINLCFYGVGANDNGVTSPSAFKANIAAFIDWFTRKYPNTVLVMCGATPLENDASETLLQALRVQMQAAVNESQKSKVYYLNLGDTFDRKDTSYYVTTDGAGVHVHLSAKGLKAIYDLKVLPFLQANNINV